MTRTALYETHVALGGRMVDFAGWELPVQYPTGPTAEHQAVRTAAGLFDIDHMGQVEVRGPDADAFLQRVQVWDVAQLQPYGAHYSLLLYDNGTIVDDIFLYRLPDRWLVAVNASNRAKDLAWLQEQTHGFAVTVTDISDATYMLALQGPKAVSILQRITPTNLSQVATRTSIETTVDGVPALLGRTGYTGEDGFELYFPATAAVTLWSKLLAVGQPDGLLPCGLAARDSLRFEACMPLYGHEINDQTNPLEARLGWTISWDKDFIGREALLKVKATKPHRLLSGFEMIDKAVAREHYELAVQGEVVGAVTTGMKSPTLDKFLGLGYLPAAHSALGTEIAVIIRGQPKKAKIVKRPFYQPRYQ